MPDPSNTPPRILCVDDRVTSLEVRRALLSRLGYDVLIASDPPTALAIMGKVSVDLVILDYNFPGQMSGEQLARKLRADRPGLPLIMLSGYPDLPDNVGESVDVLLMKGAGQPTEMLSAITKLLPQTRCRQNSIPPASEARVLRGQSLELRKEANRLKQRSQSNLSGGKP